MEKKGEENKMVVHKTCILILSRKRDSLDIPDLFLRQISSIMRYSKRGHDRIL